MALSLTILSHELSPTVSSNIVPAARARGWVVQVVDLATCMLTHFSHDESVTSLLHSDIIYYRTTGADRAISSVLCDYLRKAKKVCLNGAYDTLPHINRKSNQAIIASEAGMLCPRTLVDARPTFAGLASKMGNPFIAKLDISSQGRDVHLIHDDKKFRGLPAPVATNNYIFQEYVPHSADYRVHMLGNKAVATYRRVPAKGDFRANVSRGGTMEKVDDTMKPLLFKLAEKLGPHLGLDIYAIDFLQSETNGELYFAEANLNPGWESADIIATGVDLTELTLDFVEKKARRRKSYIRVNS